MARYVIDLPAGSAGNFQVVSAASSSAEDVNPQVRQSQIVTFNGGVAAPLAPAIVRAKSTHTTTRLVVTAFGTGLDRSRSASIVAPDTSWCVPLCIVEQTDSSITAMADVEALLPDAVFQLAASAGATSAAPLPADAVTVQTTSTATSSIYKDPNPVVYPKDFAFYYNTVPNPWRGLFHLFYIRHNKNLPDNLNETSFGHAWSSDLVTWGVDTLGFGLGAGAWDHAHVWAPSLVQNGNTYYMYYTGVDATENQTIGYATTSLLDGANTVWARQTIPAFKASQADWVDQNHLTFQGLQFRDPFVFPDPDNAGRFLMLYAAENRFIPPNPATGTPANNAVGVARSDPGTLTSWGNLGYYRVTDLLHAYADRVESPHAFPVAGTPNNWRIMYTSGSAGPTQSIDFVMASPGVSVSDTTLGIWQVNGGRVHLYSYLGNDPTVYGWDASEHLRAGKVEYLAAYDGNGIAITMMNWLGNNFSLVQPSVAAVGGADREHANVSFALAELRPGMPRVRMRISLPSAMPIRLAVYDVMGRRLRTLIEGQTPPGETVLEWDGRDPAGSAVASGVYFARLTFEGGAQVVRVPLVR